MSAHLILLPIWQNQVQLRCLPYSCLLGIRIISVLMRMRVLALVLALVPLLTLVLGLVLVLALALRPVMALVMVMVLRLMLMLLVLLVLMLMLMLVLMPRLMTMTMMISVHPRYLWCRRGERAEQISFPYALHARHNMRCVGLLQSTSTSYQN